MDTDSNHDRRMILVPIDAHGVDRATIETLVALARKLGRGLLGMVLDNARLQRVAELPFTTEIVLAGGKERALRGEQLNRYGEKIISEARHLLGELATRQQVSITFEYARGERLPALLKRSGPVDIFLPRRLRWHALAVSYVPYQIPVKALGVALSGGAEDKAVIAAAGALLGLGQANQVYILARGEPARERVAAWSRPGVRVCVQSRLPGDPVALAQLIAQSPYELLILPRLVVANMAPALLDKALDAAAGQVLLVN